MASPRTERRVPLLLAGLLVAAALLVGACGGGDSAQEEGVSRKDYIAEVDALCRKVALESKARNDALQALVDGSGSFSGRLRKGAPLLRKTHEVQSAKLERIKKIEPPAADRARIKKLTMTAESGLKVLGDSLGAADRGDLAAFIDTIFDATGDRAEAERLGEAYGFRADCFTVPIDLGQ